MPNIDSYCSPLGYTIAPLIGYNVASKASPHNFKPRTTLQVSQDPANPYDKHVIKVSLDGKHVSCVTKKLSHSLSLAG